MRIARNAHRRAGVARKNVAGWRRRNLFGQVLSRARGSATGAGNVGVAPLLYPRATEPDAWIACARDWVVARGLARQLHYTNVMRQSSQRVLVDCMLSITLDRP